MRMAKLQAQQFLPAPAVLRWAAFRYGSVSYGVGRNSQIEFVQPCCFRQGGNLGHWVNRDRSFLQVSRTVCPAPDNATAKMSRNCNVTSQPRSACFLVVKWSESDCSSKLLPARQPDEVSDERCAGLGGKHFG